MKTFALIFATLTCTNPRNYLDIPKANPDSVDAIDSDMHRAHVIFATLKSGSTDTLFSEKGGRLMLFTVSQNNAWFTMTNPNWSLKKGNCEILLCSVKHGTCKCENVVVDSGASFGDLSEGTEGGFQYYGANGNAPKIKKKTEVKEKPILVSEEEMEKRFLSDFNKSPKL